MIGESGPNALPLVASAGRGSGRSPTQTAKAIRAATGEAEGPPKGVSLLVASTTRPVFSGECARFGARRNCSRTL